MARARLVAGKGGHQAEDGEFMEEREADPMRLRV